MKTPKEWRDELNQGIIREWASVNDDEIAAIQEDARYGLLEDVFRGRTRRPLCDNLDNSWNDLKHGKTN